MDTLIHQQEVYDQLHLLGFLLPILGVMLGIAAWRGSFRPGRLANAPMRHVILTGQDLLVIVFLFLLGMIVAGMVLAPPGDDTLAVGMHTFFLQLIGYAPALAYLVYQLRRQDQGVSHFGLGRASWRVVPTGLAGLCIALPAVMALGTLVTIVMLLLGQSPPAVGHQLLTHLTQPDARLGLMMLTLSSVLLAPVFEEILYRGVVQTFLLHVLGPQRRWMILLIAGGFFASIHFHAVTPWMLLPLWALGIILGWLYETTRSLYPSILVHALFNGVNLILATIATN